ncbi:MAG: hypothetical protein ABSC15_05525 [Terriglobales bacterium]
MFDLLPENLYSRRAVRSGMILSVLWIGIGVFEIFHHRSASFFPEQGYIQAAMGAVMLIIWGTRAGLGKSSESSPPDRRREERMQDQANGKY